MAHWVILARFHCRRTARQSICEVRFLDYRTGGERTPGARELCGWAGCVNKALSRPGSENDDRRAQQCYGGAGQIPSIGRLAFYNPEPKERGADIDAAIGGVGPARCGGIGKGQ